MKKFISAITAIVLLCGCSAANSKRVFTIELDENPTTGYSWSYTIEQPDMVKELENSYHEPQSSDPTVLGAGGKRIYKFETINDGIVTFTFSYARPWEGGEIDRTYVVSYLITDGVADMLTNETTYTDRVN